jgi:hypothetical protein
MKAISRFCYYLNLGGERSDYFSWFDSMSQVTRMNLTAVAFRGTSND